MKCLFWRSAGRLTNRGCWSRGMRKWRAPSWPTWWRGCRRRSVGPLRRSGAADALVVTLVRRPIDRATPLVTALSARSTTRQRRSTARDIQTVRFAPLQVWLSIWFRFSGRYLGWVELLGLGMDVLRLYGRSRLSNHTVGLLSGNIFV